MPVSPKKRAGIVAGAAVLLQGLGWYLAQGEGTVNKAGIAILIGGSLLVYVACGLLAKAKGRSGAWGLLGLFWLLGLGIVALLPDKQKPA